MSKIWNLIKSAITPKNIFYLLAIIAVLFLGAYFKSCRDQDSIEKFKIELTAKQDTIKTLLANNAKLVVQRDSSSKEAVKSKTRADSVDAIAKKKTAQIATTRAQNDELRKKLTQACDSTSSDTTSGCHQALALANKYRAESDSNASLAATYSAKADYESRRAEQWEATDKLDKMRADDAEKQLNDVVNIKPPSDPNKLFGFIKLPSRTTVFFVGAAVGAAATLAIHH